MNFCSVSQQPGVEGESFSAKPANKVLLVGVDGQLVLPDVVLVHEEFVADVTTVLKANIVQRLPSLRLKSWW